MDIRPLSPSLSVSPLISTGDIAEMAAFGFKSLIVNIPDGEVPGQASFETIATEAARHGVVAQYLPVKPGKMGPAEVNRFRLLLATLPGPVLACCRSGQRSAMLWSAVEVQNGLPVADILTATTMAGYDLSGFLKRDAA